MNTKGSIITASSAPFAVVPANWRDMNAFHRLEKVCFPLDAWPIWDVVAVMTLPRVVRFKALVGDEIVGFIVGDLRPRERLAWIATIAVHPDFRRRGIASALLKACEEAAGLPRVRLCVRMSNEAAIQLYKNHEYVPVGTWPQYYKGGEDALLMEKVLGA